jgi:hypothetical protein
MTGSVRFYKSETENTEPNPNPEKNRVKQERTESNRFEPVFSQNNLTETSRFEPVSVFCYFFLIKTEPNRK